MARIRTIKPEFWTDERVGECSVSARLLLVASLNFADDYGGLDRSAKQLKAQAFPYDDIDCEPLVAELLGVGLFIEYESAGRKYLHIKGFRKHQRVEKPAKPRIPLYDASVNPPLPLTDSSPTSHLGVTVSSSEGNGREWKGSRNTTAGKPARLIEEPEGFAEFRQTFPPRAGSQPWQRAIKAWRARIGEGVAPGAIIAGAKRYREFILATGKEGTETVLQAATFLGPDRHYENLYPAPAKPESAWDEIQRLNGGHDGTRRIFEAEPSRPALAAPFQPVRSRGT